MWMAHVTRKTMAALFGRFRPRQEPTVPSSLFLASGLPVPLHVGEEVFFLYLCAIYVLLLSNRDRLIIFLRGWRYHALLHANIRLTSQRFVRMDQPVLVLEPLHHFLDCSVHTQSSHVQQRGFYECGHELEWRRANDSSWILHDRSNHCYPQHHD